MNFNLKTAVLASREFRGMPEAQSLQLIPEPGHMLRERASQIRRMTASVKATEVRIQLAFRRTNVSDVQ